MSPDYKPVHNTFVTRPSELLHIMVETDVGERETIVGTAPHPFYVERVRAFVPASDLQLGDRLSGYHRLLLRQAVCAAQETCA